MYLNRLALARGVPVARSLPAGCRRAFQGSGIAGNPRYAVSQCEQPGTGPGKETTMKTLHLDADELALNFDQCLKLANAAAGHLLEKQGGAMLLSFWDNDRGLESPHGVSECHFQCPIPGWQDYAANRGGALMVNFGKDDSCSATAPWR
jgi:hypothetical protein